MDVLENDRRLLFRLLETLRTGQDSRVDELVNYIRSSASTDEVRQRLDHYLQQTEFGRTPQSTDMYVDREQSPEFQNRPSTILTETPEVIVSAKPWTTVTDDDAFVSQLIYLWLTWHLPWFHCIDQEIFVRAMQSENPQSPLCSPFLVNAILAEACFFSECFEACDGDTRTNGDRFYAEAKRLLDDEEGRFSIPQGLGVMFECIQAAEGIRTLRRRQARLVLETDMSTTDLGQLIDRIELGDVVWDIASFLFREKRDYTQADLVDAVQGWHTRLSQCWEMRARCIDCEKDPLPGNLTLSMYYHSTIITIYAFL
ncbi:hypothetical protein UA08_07431 [Talaromyces atroroseus]|uniref:Transcription factor domain-containing protein n=1 Tax=Talaromyces atroroseus TaxID=1441469 RepID=A0A225ASG3_TALAT|nr:hypothetical protein UA08_07431 [Talaromyces atroroseus]OKL57365.1 hypothetical protein UA08_07431 [Talaromyces atroroseus]